MIQMLTRAEATQQGAKFAEQWDKEKHSVSSEGMKVFAQELHSLDALPAPQKNSLKWAELRGATDGLISKNVLPNLDVADNTTGLRNCRIVGLTADGDKNSANDDLVVAIGRRKDNQSKAENVVILGQDGKFYGAREVKGGYVRSEEVLANDAAELESKYKEKRFNEAGKHKQEAQGNEETKEKQENSDSREPKEKTKMPQRSSPRNLEIFNDHLHEFQHESPWTKTIAREQLNALAEEYSRLSAEQRCYARAEMYRNNDSLENNFWNRIFRPGRPQVSIIRDESGAIRFSADWNEYQSPFSTRGYRVFSKRFEL